jgi:hypothetical protein
MINPQPTPRPHLFTNRDFDAWAEQYRVLAYMLLMSPMQIAQIDFGLDPEHPEANAPFSWASEIRRIFPRQELRFG